MTGNELFHLIRSLSKSEKRYIRMQAGFQSGEKKYMLLFDVFDSLQEYDEGKLMRKLGRKMSIDNLPIERFHLAEIILKALRVVHKESSATMKINSLFADIELLHARGLFSACRKKVRTCQKLCEEHEEFESWIRSLHWEKLLTSANEQDAEFARNFTARRNLVLDRMLELIRYDDLDLGMNGQFKKSGRGDEQYGFLENLLLQPALSETMEPLSWRSRRKFAFIRSNIFFFRGRFDDAFTEIEKLVVYLEKHGIEKDRLCFFYSMFNLVNASFYMKRYDLAIGALNKMKEMYALHEHAMDDGLRTVYRNKKRTFELLLCSRLGMTGPLEKMRLDFEKEEIWRTDYRLYLEEHFMMGAYALIANRPEIALRYINMVLNNEKLVRQDIYSVARILNLVIHYELNNLSIVDSQVKSTYRYLLKQKQLFGIENAILKFLAKVLSRNFSPEKLQAMFVDLHKSLNELTGRKTDASAQDYFDFISWIEGKIRKIPVSEILLDSFGRKHEEAFNEVFREYYLEKA
jgi:hypothetical protein